MLLSSMNCEYTVVHCVIQLKIVMYTNDEAILIDMDTLGFGNPVFEFTGLDVACRLFAEYEPDDSMKSAVGLCFLSFGED